MYKPILDPPIPYVDNIQGPCTPQSLVRIQGTTPGIAYRFNINLQCGPTTSPQDDIAIQISVRILDGTIVLNSLHNGIWGDEQVSSNLPIKRSEWFEIIILCESNSFKVAINGQHYCEFPQRIRCDKISHLAIDGDVSIIQISYEKASFGSAPSASSPRPVAPIAEGVEDFEIIDNSRPQSGYQSGQPGFKPLPAGIHPPSNGGGFNDPPPYEETIHGKQFQPFPNSGSPYPNQPGFQAAYPPATAGYPQPTVGFQPVGGSAPYPPAGGGYPPGTYPPGAYPPAQTPLNVAGSNFRPIKRNHTTKKLCTFFWTLAIIIIMVIVVMVTKSRKSSSSSYSQSSSYDDGYNNNNYYYDNNNWSKN